MFLRENSKISIKIKDYNTNNTNFITRELIYKLQKRYYTLSFSDVDIYYQNGTAKNIIEILFVKKFHITFSDLKGFVN